MKTNELIGTLLDYWVAMGERLKVDATFVSGHSGYMVAFIDGELTDYNPSINWAQGGPIIKRENIQIVHRCGGANAGNGHSGIWSACTWHRGSNGRRSIAHHETDPLIAAMRCYVHSKFGDEVQN